MKLTIKLSKQQALDKIRELQSFVDRMDNVWVTVDYSVIPKEVFDRYGAKPFEIMKCKMRKDGRVWDNITWSGAKSEAHKLGYRLPAIQEMLVLLDWYKHEKGDRVSYKDKKFLGIEELSYEEEVYSEWIDAPSPCRRGGDWGYSSGAGAFTLYLHWGTGVTNNNVGFRCCK